ncbi:HDOD domain-containing protein [Chitinispirillales bacterium ANBcel5]|uniref:HDOD domain-containing protein n=1 Tax=Cellulosispirillum alkaliphilum TaxID=3039283 RepID=UPI002A5848FC|nr:HDOD domain-containing protein [Chitinispirillales bacterium ANBcel5]
MNQNSSISSAQNSERYHRIIENLDQLPSLPAIVLRLLKIVNSPDTSAEDAASLIEKDPALTSKMLRLANSAFYGIPRSISSVSSAVVILGFNTIRSLVLSASLVKMFSGEKYAFSNDAFWKHSIVTAMAAKTITRHFMNIRMMDPESAFCSGIIHDIGKLILNQYASDDYYETCEYAKKESVPLIKAEEQILGVTHAGIGSILADRWALPIELGNCLVHHHSPDQKEIASELVATVHVANFISHELGCDLWEDEICSAKCKSALRYLNIAETEYLKIRDTIEKTMENSMEFLSIIK